MNRRRAYTQLTKTLLGAIGVAACGGKAVVDPPGEASGGSSSSSSATGVGGASTSVGVATSVTATSSTTTGTSTGSSGVGGSTPFTCDITLPPYQSLVYHCLTDKPNNSCAPSDAQSVAEGLRADLEWSDCDNACCIGEYLTDVPCGPDPNVPGVCCYYATLEYYDVCEGRPFAVAQRLRTAEVARCPDWRASLQPTLAGLEEEVREHLADGWLSAALDEHASVAAFARFTMQLLAVGAPPELIRATQKATIDEVTHAELCFGLASAYAGEPLGPGPLDVADALEAVSDPRAIALAVVHEGCVGETVSAMVACAALEHCEDRATLRVLQTIQRDETRHAGLAWQYLTWALRREPTLAFEVADAFRRAAATIEAQLAACPPDAVDLRVHGRLGRRQRLEVARDTMREVIVPCARALLHGDEEPRSEPRPRV
jgi:hypothetical protein